MDSSLKKHELDAWRAFLEAHSAVVRALERDMQEEQGLPLTWYDVLVNLAEAPGGRLRLQALAESVLLSRSGLTRLVDRMAAGGLVRREPCPEDRRGSYAVLTREGREALSNAAPGHLRGIAKYFAAPLSSSEMRVLRMGLRRVAQATRPATS